MEVAKQRWQNRDIERWSEDGVGTRENKGKVNCNTHPMA